MRRLRRVCRVAIRAQLRVFEKHPTELLPLPLKRFPNASP